MSHYAKYLKWCNTHLTLFWAAANSPHYHHHNNNVNNINNAFIPQQRADTAASWRFNLIKQHESVVVYVYVYVYVDTFLAPELPLIISQATSSVRLLVPLFPSAPDFHHIT